MYPSADSRQAAYDASMPVLVEILLTAGSFAPSSREPVRNWVLMGHYPTAEKALRATEKACQCYQYRMRNGAGEYFTLEWIDDPADPDRCIAEWQPIQ